MIMKAARSRRRSLCLLGAALANLLPLPASAQEVPLPPRRPSDLGGVQRPATGEPAGSKKPAEVEAPRADGVNGCLARLRDLGADVDPAVQLQPSNASCAIEEPVRLRGLTLTIDGGFKVGFPDQPVLACRFAEPLTRFVRDLVAPVVAGQTGGGTELKTIHTGPGFECRNQNRAASGKLSAHGTGIAVDVAALVLTSGDTIAIKTAAQDQRHKALISAIRTAACGWFTTVLGPGSDAYHDDHLHLDIQQHGSSDRYRICQ